MKNSSDMMMNMAFHFGEREIILFRFWKTGTFSGMAVSMLIVFLLCILYEAIKGFRLFLAISHAQQRRNAHRNSQSDMLPGSAEARDDTSSMNSITFAPLLTLTGVTKRLFTVYRLSQGALYGIQALLAYVLMLVVMTFNVSLVLTVVVGEAVGYFLFTGSPLTDTALADCC